MGVTGRRSAGGVGRSAQGGQSREVGRRRRVIIGPGRREERAGQRRGRLRGVRSADSAAPATARWRPPPLTAALGAGARAAARFAHGRRKVGHF